MLGRLAACALVASLFLAPPPAAAETSGSARYVLAEPGLPVEFTCNGYGLFAACFLIPEGYTRFRAYVVDASGMTIPAHYETGGTVRHFCGSTEDGVVEPGRRILEVTIEGAAMGPASCFGEVVGQATHGYIFVYFEP